MKYSDLVKTITMQFLSEGGNRFVPFIVGKPGGGKSSCARDIAEVLAERLGVPAERVVEFNPSLREPTDILGLPQMDGEFSRWLPPEELYRLRKGQGPCILIIEELSDASMDMQNPLCRVILDRYAGQMPLSDELYIIATGNRTEDRSGANRLSTKLANRMRILSFDEDLDDWLDWAASHGINPVLRAFIKFRPALLSDFDPKRPRNPTPRAWEDVSRIPMDMEPTLYMEHVAGAVGEGAAAEFTGFLKVFQDLPDFDAILKNPANAEVPNKPDVLYAVSAKLMSIAEKKNFSKIYAYLRRMPPDFLVMVMKEMMRDPKQKAWISKTKEFTSFVMEFSAVMV